MLDDVKCYLPRRLLLTTKQCLLSPPGPLRPLGSLALQTLRPFCVSFFTHSHSTHSDVLLGMNSNDTSFASNIFDRLRCLAALVLFVLNCCCKCSVLILFEERAPQEISEISVICQCKGNYRPAIYAELIAVPTPFHAVVL